MRTFVRSFLVAAVACFWLGAPVFSQAALIERDLVPGDGALVFDSATGLEWLDLTKTGGRSFGDVSANFGPGGDFTGFRYATRAEVIAFFTNAGIPDLDTGEGGTAANRAPVTALMALWDADLWGLHDGFGEFGYFLTAEIPGPGLHDTGLLWTPPGDAAEATTGDQRIGSGIVDETSFSFLGSALVRVAGPGEEPTGVPAPAPLALLIGGIVALAIRRRR